MRRPIYFILCTTVLTAGAAAQEAADFFRQNCISCHTVGGGRLTGPDFKNVTQRKERE
jgi:mono/diheme cytochrome c family protein